MILVAGLTPAWQQILEFDTLALGSVNRAREAWWCASGKVLNVGLALAHLDVAAHTLAPLGGWARAPIEDEFRTRRASAQWIATAAPTRVCTTILDRATAQTTELVQNAAELADHELAEFIELFQRAAHAASAIVFTGSLPKGTRASVVAELLAGQVAPVVLDVRGPELLEALVHRPALVKPNVEELQATLARPCHNIPQIVEGMRELMDRGAQNVLITRGSETVLLATSNEIWELSPAPVSAVVNPIGCGDCLAAGIAWGITQCLPICEAVALGMGAAADNLSALLPAQLNRERVTRLAGRVECRRFR